MSVEYGKPHAADIPVVDLDDPEDDVLFLEQNNSRHERNRSSDFLESLDYEDPQPSGWISKLSSYFSSRLLGLSYELARGSQSSDFFDLSDDDALNSNPRDELRDYRIKRLNQKLNKTIMLFALVLVGIVGAFFYRRHLSHASAEEKQPHEHQKRILSNSTHDFYPSTILVSLDGFHPHYINPQNTPAMHKMMVEDYGAPYMVPSFPSSTFPNHWTLITGLYPAEHGIVGNTFFDPVLGKQFINTDPNYGFDPQFWQGGEPLWTTAHKQGVNSAVHMWPGSEVPTIGDNGPLFVDKYNGSELLSSKVERVMEWIDTEKIQDRPELILTYVPTIDQFGHKFGISGQNLTDALHYVDDFVALMIELLKVRNLTDIVNLVVVSDHGMAPTSNDRLLFLDDVVDTSKIEHVDGWPLFGLRPYKGHSVNDIMNEIDSKMSKMEKNITENYSVYRVEDIPKEYNFGGKENDHKFNYRLAPIWIIPNVGYSITTHKKFKEDNNQYYPRGVHGYNNTHLLMRAIFLGRGPYFNEKLADSRKVLPFANTEVYGMICDSLDIKPSPNNGSSADSKGFAISSNNLLPNDWRDELSYPNLPYEVEHVVKDATYDLLWRKPVKGMGQTTVSVSLNKHPYESILSEESSFLSVTSVSLPKPSDFLDAVDADESSSVAPPDGNSDGEKGTSDDESGFGKIVEGIDDIWEDAEDAVGDAVDGFLDAVGSLFGGNNDEEKV